MRTLIVFAKAPRPGHVKTRLAADPKIGREGAARLAEAFLRDTLLHARRVRDVELVVEFAPREERAWFEALANGARLEPQADGDLGERMRAAFERELARGAQRVVIVGSDTPHLEARAIEDAFTRLDTAELVLGPSEDGGYYLIALRRRADELFRGIEWSTPEVLARTLAIASEVGLSLALLPPLFDVDEPADLRRLRREIASGRAECPHVARME